MCACAKVSEEPKTMKWEVVEGPVGKAGGVGPKAAQIECSEQHVYISTVDNEVSRETLHFTAFPCGSAS